MNMLRNIFIVMVVMLFAVSCEKEIDNLKKLDNVTAPANVKVTFDVTQDNSGLVTIYPSADGITRFLITFGDNPAETPQAFKPGEIITHVYSEGQYNVGVIAEGITGLRTAIQQSLTVSFRAPENLVVSITPDVVNPKKVSISATANFATVMDIYFGEVENEEPVQALPGETVTHIYEDPGDYLIKVIARSAGQATTEFTQTITIQAATEPVLLPISFESFTVNYAFINFGNATSIVVDNPDKTGLNTSDKVAQFTKANGAETWAGSLLTLGAPINFSTNKVFKVKTWSPKVGAVVKIKVENIESGEIAHEVDASTTVANAWEELSWDFSAINTGNEYQKLVFFFDFGNTGDGSVYYFDDVKLISALPATGLAGTWKMAPEAGSLGVGPSKGDMSWWAIDDAGVVQRSCFFDDTYVFGINGSFSNVLGTDTWVEEWQGNNPASCAAPVAPHNGSAAATYTYDKNAGTVTVSGTGAYLGIPKVFNGGELSNPANAPASITYEIELLENETVMILDISIGGGWWRFKLVKESGGIVSPLVGSWQVAPEAGSLGVGPGQGDMSWWAIDNAGVVQRACFFDDAYVFGADGSFSNELGAETWIEDWQGGSNACGSPVAPHNGAAATYIFDENAGTVTLNGVGAYLGIPKAFNGGELNNPANAPASITYIVALSENNTVMTVDISIGGGWWRFKLVKN